MLFHVISCKLIKEQFKRSVHSDGYHCPGFILQTGRPFWELVGSSVAQLKKSLLLGYRRSFHPAAAPRTAGNEFDRFPSVFPLCVWCQKYPVMNFHGFSIFERFWSLHRSLCWRLYSQYFNLVPDCWCWPKKAPPLTTRLKISSS